MKQKMEDKKPWPELSYTLATIKCDVGNYHLIPFELKKQTKPNKGRLKRMVCPSWNSKRG